jgi:hypothetical protein
MGFLAWIVVGAILVVFVARAASGSRGRRRGLN